MRENPDTTLHEVVIPKEDAVFRLDANGCWCNDGGRFRNKKIIDYFHASIRKDADGYHLFQIRDNIREKVYFPYEDTALFVFDVVPDADTMTLVLNTGARILLDPSDLFVHNDHLYVAHAGDRVKFTDRSLMKLSKRIGFENGTYTIWMGDRNFPIGQELDPDC